MVRERRYMLCLLDHTNAHECFENVTKRCPYLGTTYMSYTNTSVSCSAFYYSTPWFQQTTLLGILNESNRSTILYTTTGVAEFSLAIYVAPRLL
jgi:hypothetical protein